LRHHAIVGGDDQHDDVRHVRPAGAHRAEGGVAGRVEESDLLQLVLALGMGDGDGVGANVLGNAAGFARGDVGFANHIKQRGLAVVNMTHDGHDRRAQFQVFRTVPDISFDRLGWRVHHTRAALAFFDLEPELVFGTKPLRRGFVNGLIDVGENTQFHQVGDQLEWFLVQPFSQIADNDRRLESDEFAGGRRNKFGPRRRSERRGRLAGMFQRKRRYGLSAGGFGGGYRWRWFGRQFNRAGFPAELGRRMNPIFSPMAGLGGLGGAVGSTFAPTVVGSSGGVAGVSAIGAVASTLRLASGGSAGVGTAGASGGAETMRMGSGGGGACGGSGAATGLRPPSCSSRYSAVILSSELDGTFAPVMPSALALARTSLLSIPSFFAMS